MADSKISALPAATVPLAGTEVLPIVQSSTTKQVSVANLTAGRAVSASSITNAGLTSGRVTYAGASGLLTDSANLTFDGTNLTTAGSETAARFVPSGSTVATNGMYLSAANALSFSTNSTNRVTVDANGQLLVTGGVQSQFNSNSGSYNFYIAGANSAGADAVLNLSAPGSNSAALTYVRNTSLLTVVNGGSGGVSLASGGVAWIAISDERQKENLVPITDAITKITSLRAVTGNYIYDKEKISKAFLIAQDVEKVLPEAVDNSNPDVKGLAYTDVIPLLVASIKEQQVLIEALTTRLTALEAK